MARAADTYRGARRNAARQVQAIRYWRLLKRMRNKSTGVVTVINEMPDDHDHSNCKHEHK